MIELLVPLYCIGVVGCLLLVLTHRGAWPYVPESDKHARRRRLFRFFVAMTVVALFWPVLILWFGTTTLIEELT